MAEQWGQNWSYRLILLSLMYPSLIDNSITSGSLLSFIHDHIHMSFFIIFFFSLSFHLHFSFWLLSFAEGYLVSFLVIVRFIFHIVCLVLQSFQLFIHFIFCHISSSVVEWSNHLAFFFSLLTAFNIVINIIISIIISAFFFFVRLVFCFLYRH